MTLYELKPAVDAAVEMAIECGEDIGKIPVSLQIDSEDNYPVMATECIELHYNDNVNASGCVIVGFPAEKEEQAVTVEEQYIIDTIKSARHIQTFLWGEANGSWGLEQWRRMFIKRYAKIEMIEMIENNNPHAMVEFRKRLLQNAALSVALLAILHDKKELTEDISIVSTSVGGSNA